MKKSILMSCAAATILLGAETDLGTIKIEEKVTTKIINNVSTKEVKNADLAEALDKKSPSVSLIRRSGIANDIVLRGQKRDNIRVTIDDALVCGACPNRMDPPTSHVITTNVDSVEINEGPFDVSEFGTLSGGVKVKTVKPTKELSGEISATAGSFGYQKGVVSVSGGNDIVKALVTYSKEESDQYEDGDGRTLAEQTYDKVNGTSNTTSQYSSAYKDMKAYEKKSMMVKTIITPTDNQELEISATKNESDNILYPSSGMDAIYDDSNIYNLKYSINDLGDLSKKLEIRTYKTDVDHPMSTMYRLKGSATEMTNHLTTDVSGTKILNTFDALDREFTVGIDTSKRNWDGHYSTSGVKNNSMVAKSINDTDTTNNALFVKCKNEMEKLTLELGARYDSTDVETAGTDKDNSYSGLTGNIFATYHSDLNTKYFVGLGTATRVPDARELYFVGKTTTGTISIGTQDLKETKNTELDFGAEHHYKSAKIKAKFFYSKLSDYIYYKKTTTADRFYNIDATIYGMELSGAYYINDKLTLDAGYTYKRGEKDQALGGQTDTDLADITPPKLTLALTYDHSEDTYASVEFINVAKWSNYDGDNGEQEIDGYNVVNLKGQTTFAKSFEITLGVDNLFDKTYAVSNTYADLTLLSDGTDVMLLNEPGRYVYTSLKYKF